MAEKTGFRAPSGTSDLIWDDTAIRGQVRGNFVKFVNDEPKQDLHGFDIVPAGETRVFKVGEIVEILIDEGEFDEQAGRPQYDSVLIQARKDSEVIGPVAWKRTTRVRMPSSIKPASPFDVSVISALVCFAVGALLFIDPAGVYAPAGRLELAIPLFVAGLFNVAVFMVRKRKARNKGPSEDCASTYDILSPHTAWWKARPGT